MSVCITLLHAGDLNEVSPGGISTYLQHFIRHFASHGYRITLLGVAPRGSDYAIGKHYSLSIDGHEFIFIPLAYSGKRPLQAYYLLGLLRYLLTQRPKSDKSDVYFCQRPEYVLPLALLRPNKNIAMAVHGSSRYSFLYWQPIVAYAYNLLERFAVRRCQLTIVLLFNEQFGLGYYRRLYRKYSSKIRYGAVPVDLPSFRPQNLETPRAKYIIYHGRIENNPKQVLLLPNILAQVLREIPDVRMRIIGDGSDRELLVQRFHDLGLEQSVEFLRQAPNNQIPFYLRGMGVGILLSKFEGICLSAIECLASGIPVVGTDVGDLSRYIIPGKNGHLIGSGTDEEIIHQATRALIASLTNSDIKAQDCIESVAEYGAPRVMDDLERALSALKS